MFVINYIIKNFIFNFNFSFRGVGVLPYISGNDDILVLNSAINNDIQVVGENLSRALRPSRNVELLTQRRDQTMNRGRELFRFFYNVLINMIKKYFLAMLLNLLLLL